MFSVVLCSVISDKSSIAVHRDILEDTDDEIFGTSRSVDNMITE